MAAMFFEKRKFPHSILFPIGQIYCIPNFKLIGPTVYALQFSQSYSATKWRIWSIFLFDQKTMSYTCILSLVKISHSVHEL